MAGNVAHEINNPLAIIKGKAGIIKLRVEEKNLDLIQIKEDLSKIEATAERIAKTIRGLRLISRNADGDPMILVGLSALFEKSLEMCKEKFRHHSIDLNADCQVEVEIECRPSQISQVLMNLLSNAYDAVEMLSEKRILVEVTVLGDSFKMSVTDSGTGVSSKIIDKIMQPFSLRRKWVKVLA